MRQGKLRGAVQLAQRFALLGGMLVAVGQCAAVAGASDGPTVVQPVDLQSSAVKSRVRDSVSQRTSDVTAAGSTTHTFHDPEGRRIILSSPAADLDLRPYAEILAATTHRGEIERLVTEVLPPDRVPGACGADVDACYLAGDPATAAPALMRVPSHHPDLVHLLTHEYGHHVDNELRNVAQFQWGCELFSDGSRDWFLERDLRNDVLDRGFDCASSRHGTGLGELFAEDYVRTNGLKGWALENVPPPTVAQMAVLNYDFMLPLKRRTVRTRRMVEHRRWRTKRIRTRHWTFATVTLRGPRRSDLDLYLFHSEHETPVQRSIRRGSRERVQFLLRPFEPYEVVVVAHKRRGRARLTITLD